MKYAKHLKCLYYIGKCSKYLYYMKKVLCVCALAVVAVLGLSCATKYGCICKKAIKELF